MVDYTSESPDDSALNFANRTLYHGDNLGFLRGMNSRTVQLIATDPPFNKGRDFHATPDSLADGAQFEDRWSWRDDVHDEWLDQIQGDYPQVWSAVVNAKEVHSAGMGAFICWLGVRLLEMHRVLRDDGSIYLHIDHKAHAYVKVLMDAVFGQENFRNEILWIYGKSARGGKGIAKQYARNNDIILFYSRSDKWTFNPPIDYHQLSYKEAKKKGFQRDERGWFKTAPRGNYTDASIAKLEKEGRIYRTRNGTIRIRYDLPERDGQVLEQFRHGSAWDDIPDMMHVPKSERTGYPTQKPLALYERIIKASSNPGDFVLDPFCGCATTPIAAERLGRQWVGMDIWDAAYQTVIDRLVAEGMASENGRGPDGQMILAFDSIHEEKTAPQRTDDAPAAPVFDTPRSRRANRHPPPRTQHERLLTDLGAYCQGCGSSYSFDPRVLEVDHVRPKSDGGSDAYDNLTLLCPPCNREKRDRYTLTYLQQLNRRNGWLKPANEANIRHGRAGGQNRRARRR